MSEAKTLKEWRELKGLGREDLAEALSDEIRSSAWWPVDEEDIARWEDVGFPVREGIEADKFGREVVAPLMRILGAEGGIMYKEVPASFTPGDYVLDPGRLEDLTPDVLQFLQEHAEEIGLRVAIPNAYDVAPKPYQDLEPEDGRALLRHYEAERLHAETMYRRMDGLSAQLQEHSTDPNATVGDVFEERGGWLVPKQHTEDQE